MIEKYGRDKTDYDTVLLFRIVELHASAELPVQPTVVSGFGALQCDHVSEDVEMWFYDGGVTVQQ